ncbi:MAG: hypothetical protein L0H64_12960 [Pseudonocardia sp.]|nr:hypothetical protein [Pseudonocardia sp.]
MMPARGGRAAPQLLGFGHLALPVARYHGSLTEHHGPVRVTGPCQCDPCLDDAERGGVERWELLLPDGWALHCVRLTSFTRAPTSTPTGTRGTNPSESTAQ